MNRMQAIDAAMDFEASNPVSRPVVVYRIFDNYAFSEEPPDGSEFIALVDGKSISTFDGRLSIKWRPVADGLPKDEGRVLVFTDGVDFSGQQFFDVLAEDFNDHDEEGRRSEVIEAVTHWARLPYPADV